MYSEQKPLYLLNAGYMLEQIDLFLASLNIGTCWYALAKTKDPTSEGLDYIIMLAFGKSHSEDFRKDFSKTNRKDLDAIWKGEHYLDIGEIVRYAPSACNTQPWRVVSEDNCLRIYRTTQIKSFMPASKLSYYNSIDMGIFICFLDRVVVACRACGLRPIDGPYSYFKDPEGFVAAARRAAVLGFEGKMVIHPSQIEPANRIFSPSAEEIEKAQRIMEAMAQAAREGRGAVQLDGRLIDIANIRMAQNLLQKSQAIAAAGSGSRS
jgi:hypothetical protein